MIDTSAILAWLKDEPARARIVAGLEAHQVMSPRRESRPTPSSVTAKGKAIRPNLEWRQFLFQLTNATQLI